MDIDKFAYYNELFLAYKDLIKENNRDIFDLYYGENLTMQEIADIKSISKARVGIIIKNVEKELCTYEDKLRIVLKNNILEDALNLEDIKEIKKDINNVINIEDYLKNMNN